MPTTPNLGLFVVDPNDTQTNVFDWVLGMSSTDPNSNMMLLDAAIKDQQDKLTFDEAPKEGSVKPVTSDGVYTALAGKATTATYTANVTISWTKSGDHYYQDIAVYGILATDNPIPGVAYGEDNDANVLYDECFDKVLRFTTSANSIRVWAKEAISTAFPMQFKVVR